MRNDKTATSDGFTPLPNAEFQILLALLDRPRHGHGIRVHVAERTKDAVEIGPGTLYMAIKRMLRRGLIEETSEHPDPEVADDRRRYYRITDSGKHIAKSEAERLRSLLDLAVAKNLLGKASST